MVSLDNYIFVFLHENFLLGSPFFVLGYYGTDNKINFKDNTARTLHIQSEFAKRGVRVLCYGTDGALSFLKSQKHLVNFGNFSQYGPLTLVGDITSDYQASQDAFHDAKKMKSALYDQSDVRRLGKFSATVNHLIMVYKKFGKNEHGLTLADLDPNDRMNYK